MALVRTAICTKVDAAVKRLIGLLDNVLRLSQVEEGKEIFVPVMFDMREALQLVVDNFDATPP